MSGARPVALAALLALGACADPGDLPTREDARKGWETSSFVASPSARALPPPSAAYIGPATGPEFRRRDEAGVLERPLPEPADSGAVPVSERLERAAEARAARERAERAAERVERRERELRLRREAAEAQRQTR